MSKLTTLNQRISNPAPKWYRVFNRLWPQVENLIMVGLLLVYPEDALQIAFAKAGLSILRGAVDAYITE